jgi:hypothetical protein
MSRAFIELGLLVVAAFALGLFVGWMAWASGSRQQSNQEPADDTAMSSRTSQESAGWSGRQLAEDGQDGKAQSNPRTSGGRSDQTVSIRPREWDTSRRR